MSVAEEKDEATDENNAVSNHSSGYISSGQRTKQCIEKGSDAQVFLLLFIYLRPLRTVVQYL